jgi:hypothetical protein
MITNFSAGEATQRYIEAHADAQRRIVELV